MSDPVGGNIVLVIEINSLAVIEFMEVFFHGSQAGFIIIPYKRWAFETM